MTVPTPGTTPVPLCTRDLWCPCTCNACTVTEQHCRPADQLADGWSDYCLLDPSLPMPKNVVVTDTDLLLDRATNMAHLAAGDVTELIDQLPAGTPLFAYADLVAAKAHLAAAVRKLDQAATQLDTTGDQ